MTRRMASYPTDMSPMSMLKPMLNPSKPDHQSTDMSTMMIQRALDQLLDEFQQKGGQNKVRHFNTSSSGNNHHHQAFPYKPQGNSYAMQEKVLHDILFPTSSSQHHQRNDGRAADLPQINWWTDLTASNKQAKYAPKMLQMNRFNQSMMSQLPMGPSNRYSPFQTLPPPAGKPPKMTKHFRTNNVVVPLLDRGLQSQKAQSGFQPLNIMPPASESSSTSSSASSGERSSPAMTNDGSLSDSSSNADEKLPLYKRSAATKFQLVVPSSRRPVTRSRSQSGKASPTQEEHDLVMKVVNGSADEIQKLIEDFLAGEMKAKAIQKEE